MRITLKGTNIELTPELKAYAEEKIETLAKFNPKITEVDCELGLTSRHHQKGNIYRAELNVSVSGAMLRVEKNVDSIYKAIDKVRDHMAEMLTEDRGKKISRKRGVSKEERV